MYTPPQKTEYRTYRHPPTLGTLLLLAALPLAVLFATAFPAVAAGTAVGLTAGTTLGR